jgi:hypothetical protein
MKARRILSFIYRTLNATSFGASLIGWCFTRKKYPQTDPIICGDGKGDMPRIAFVCDEMTWQNFKDECNAMFVTPSNWREGFERFKPEVFFCESAWKGIDDEPDSWVMRIGKNPKSFYENRKDLLSILKYCKKKSIKTVFWNKEDPTNFDEFAPTALLFDYVFTTAEECIPKYKSLGCKNVKPLAFGVPEHIFCYNESIKKENTAVFAGSWFANYERRCKEMEEVFDMIIEKDIELIIYNRRFGTKHTTMQFPVKYMRYLRPAVPYNQLAAIYRKSRYAITINTVTDSDTMFARRVFEIMACGCIVISNECKGLRKMFDGRIWFYGDTFDYSREREIVRENVREVMEKHTCRNRLLEVIKTIKYE